MKQIPPKARFAQIYRTPHSLDSREGLELMDRNERTVDFPPEVMEDLRQTLTPFLLRAYPEPEVLYRRLAEWLHLPRPMLLLTSGADGGLRSIFDVFVEPGDEVVSVNPSYAMYPIYCGISGALLQQVPFEEDLSLSLEKILSQIRKKTKLVLLANPNQPIERVYSEKELQVLLEVCLKNEALLVMDEAYHHFCPFTAVPYLKGNGNLIIVRSFSKAFGIAGLRLGYLVAQPETIVQLNKVRPMYEAHSFAIAVGIYLLEHDHLMKSYVMQVKEAMTFLKAAFLGLGFQASGQWGNSTLVTLPLQLPAQEIARGLRRKGFLIRAETQAPLSNHLRITLGSKAQAQRLWAAFEAVLLERKMAHVIS